MRLNCPHCGERPIDEFVQLGTADQLRPAADAGIDAFVDYVYLRDNPAGPHRELFQHLGGCRALLAVRRDTRTHEVHAVTAVGDAR
jgi:heterotetrameric sarcosine oxidase delta subunit